MKPRTEQEERALAELAKRSTTPKTEGGLKRSESGDPYEGIPLNARILVICPVCGNREEMTVRVMKRIRACAKCGQRINRARIFAAKADEVAEGWREEERKRRAPKIFDMAGRVLKSVRKDN